jgi:hypothetical protein
LTARFRTLRVSSSDKRLTVLVAGYVYDGTGPPRWFGSLISNFQSPIGPDADEAVEYNVSNASEAAREFAVQSHYDGDPGDADRRPSGLLPLGVEAAVPPAEAHRLFEMVMADKPADAIADKAIDLLRNVAADPRTHGFVSPDCMAVILDSDLTVEPVEQFRPLGGVTSRIVWPSRIDGRSGVPPFQITDFTVTAPVPLRFLIAPSEACHCGSGRKYKHCHGRKPRRR